ncbi:GNAT family N-acetyltransferase [Sphingomonas montana]|uniref:GNAT family N-acetyltransferase n=1 Tax=Sphingomonas montana TaxID=1843236 RepID=UPI001F0A3036|nr:GNAT family N-acetyltransferase [Sphingomonas montana]
MKVPMHLDRIHAAPSATTTLCVRAADAAQVPGLMADWAALVAHAAEPNAFAEPWFATASTHLAGAGDVRLLVVRQGDVLVGLLPVVVARHYGRLHVAHIQNHLHYHSFLGTPLIRAGQERLFWSAILDLLDTARWACGLLHLTAITEDGPVHRGLAAAATARGRPCDVVHRHERALLQSTLGPGAYYERTVRKKKRKEIRRLEQRLAECGTVTTRHFAPGDDLTAWTDAFLALEASGWKGAAGSALGSGPETTAFFRAALAGAQAAGRLDLLRIDVDGAPVAMLVNFLTQPGAFSFKIAFDEGYARFSPGVLIQIANYAILDRPEILWMDSCAVENHAMINSLWGERRALVRLSVPLSGPRRRLTFATCRLAERLSARIRTPRPHLQPEPADAA